MDRLGERCKSGISAGEEKEPYGQVLCEDCCVDLFSPAKACDLWVVYSAKAFAGKQGHEPQLNPVQQEILGVLRKGGAHGTGEAL